jgi:hypothetical protein
MSATLRAQSAPALRWWVQRNPAYVFSAACMACGARMFLVPEQALPAGDLAVILVTLGILQLYEMGVTSILMLLRGNRRAPEDQPSLMVVGMIFWTGPLIATMEMTALAPGLGLVLALACCVVALGEIVATSRCFGWRVSPATHGVMAAAIVLVAAAQPMLAVADAAAGTNELLLYGLWWVVALLLVPAGVGLARARAPGVEGVLTLSAVGAAALHLWAMNHAFYGHARPFYAVPLLAMVAVVGMRNLRAGTDDGEEGLLALAFLLPGLGIYLSIDRFDSVVLAAGMPRLLRDPLLVGLALAAGAWACGFARHRLATLGHLASLAGMFAVERLLLSGVLRGDFLPTAPTLAGLRGTSGAVFFGSIGVYFAGIAFHHRSRAAGFVALLMLQFGVARVLPANWTYAQGFLAVTWAWTVLGLLHVALRRPPLWLRLLPIAFLGLASWLATRKPELFWLGWAHLAGMVALLGCVGWWAPWTRYRGVAAGLVGATVGPEVVVWSLRHPHGPAALVVGAGFVLLAGGLAISWYKSALLARLRVPTSDEIDAEASTSLP